MSDISVLPYRDEFIHELSKFTLGTHQKDFTVVPTDVLEEALKNNFSLPFAVFSNDDHLVGFFILESYYQYEGFSTPYNSVFVRALSINESLQGKGYGKKLVLAIPNIAKKYISTTTHLYLVVDYKNIIALNLYERAGFIHVASKPDGPIGEERLYYLNLNNKYKNDISLNLNISNLELEVEIFLNEIEKIGYITGYLSAESYSISTIFIKENYRRKGIAASSLRMLGSYLRKKNDKINTIEIDVSNNDIVSNILIQSGFAKFTVNDLVIYRKFIK